MHELFEASGGSMWPLLRSGDKVLVRRAGARSLKPGDIAAYRYLGRVVCHRLVRATEARGRLELLCRGDFDPRGGLETVAQEQCLGKVVAVVRGREILPVRNGPHAWLALRRLAQRLSLAVGKIIHGKSIPDRRPR